MKRIADGKTVIKCNSEKGDGHRDGAEAVVIESVGPIEFKGDPETYGYMVKWADMPHLPVFVAGDRIIEKEASVENQMEH